MWKSWHTGEGEGGSIPAQDLRWEVRTFLHAGTGDQPHYSHPPPARKLQLKVSIPTKTCQPRNSCRSLLSLSPHLFLFPPSTPFRPPLTSPPSHNITLSTDGPTLISRISSPTREIRLHDAPIRDRIPAPSGSATWDIPFGRVQDHRAPKGRRARYIDTSSCTGTSAPDRRHGFRADAPQDGDAGILRHAADNSS